jgi:hypothetical protein
MARLARCEFCRLLFRSLFGGPNLGFERFDMGFQGSDELAGKRSFIRIAEALSAAVSPRAVVPTGRWPNPRSLVVSERLLPLAALRPLANRLGRHPQQFGGLPVGKPLARQFAPVNEDVGPPRTVIPRRTKTLNQPGLTTQERANRYLCPRGNNHLNDRKHTGVLAGLNSRARGEFRPGPNNISLFDDVTNADPIAARSGAGNLSVTIGIGGAA